MSASPATTPDAVTLLRVPEAAARARSHPRTIARWIREGRLPALRAGSRYLIEPEALERFLREGGRP